MRPAALEVQRGPAAEQFSGQQAVQNNESRYDSDQADADMDSHKRFGWYAPGHRRLRGLCLRDADVRTELADRVVGADASGRELLLGGLAALDGLGELDLLFLREERLARGGLQVEPEVVGVVRAERSGRFSHLLRLLPFWF